MAFAVAAARRQGLGERAVRVRFGSPHRALGELYGMRELHGHTGSANAVRDAFYPDLQVMLARQSEGSTGGFTLAAKGGHNDESHNHNDIGNLIVFHDGHPVLVDAGAPEYTRKTFSAKRYEIWTMQSAFHNLPTIAGHQQKPGRRFRARNIEYDADAKATEFRLELAGAYPKAAKIERLMRTVRLDRNLGQVTLQDELVLREPSDDTTWNFLTARRVERRERHLVLVRDGAVSVELHYDPRTLTVHVEPLEVLDAKLKRSWPEGLTRVQFGGPSGAKQAMVHFTLKAAKR